MPEFGDVRFNRWEQGAGGELRQLPEQVSLRSPLDPVIFRPGIPWCVGDVLAGLRGVNAGFLTSSIIVGGFTALGVCLGVAGIVQALLPKKENESAASAASMQIKMNGFQNGAFAVSNFAAWELMCIPLALWCVSSYLLSNKTLEAAQKEGMQESPGS